MRGEMNIHKGYEKLDHGCMDALSSQCGGTCRGNDGRAAVTSCVLWRP